MENLGTVVAAENDIVTVKIIRKSECKGCGTCKMFGSQEILIKAKNTANARIGDTVQISEEAGAFVKALGFLYGIPFAALIAGFFAGSHAGNFMNLGYYSALTGFFFGVFLAFFCIKMLKHMENRREKADKYRAYAVKIINN